MDVRLEKLINESLDLLYTNEIYLIEHKPVDLEKTTRDKQHVSERSIMNHLAYYMKRLMDEDEFFLDFSLDCEYNRNLDGVKALPSFKNGACPDIIIHRRGSNENNYAVIELKTYWNNDQKRDKKKIREFMDIKGEYGFQNGVLILIAEERTRVEVEEVFFERNEEMGPVV